MTTFSRDLEPAKRTFATALSGNLLSLSAVRSVTLTGSFVDRPGLAGISDIDVIVIVDALHEAVFAACREAALSVSPSLLGLPDHRLVLNDTFGPLKFDAPGIVVVHLMVYDLASHREHTLKSPFTCLDWERSRFFQGRSLRETFPTLALQPRHFVDARRSLASYLEDIAAGCITYRCHEFAADGRCSEMVKRLPLDERHQGEYAFHIVSHLVANYAKLIQGHNRRLDPEALADFWRSELPDCAEFLPWFTALAAAKQARALNFPADTVPRTREFLARFGATLRDTWERRARRHLFVRHGRTALNDGSFLGQRRDPGLIAAPAALTSPPSRVFSSPALRCRETAAALAPAAEVILDPRLHEIDYGRAEGLTPAQLMQAFPDLPTAWAAQLDPRFPDGECTTDVAARLAAFTRDLSNAPSLVVTHNVVLRCLLGEGLGVPRHLWHHLPVGHLELIEIFQLNGRLYLNLTAEQTARAGDALAGHLT